MSPTVLTTQGGTTLRPRILVVDDEVELLDAISDTVAARLNCRLIRAANLSEAQHIMQTQSVDLLVTDLHLPDGDGATLLPILRSRHPNAHAIVITGSPSVDGAITALRAGAVDFLLKPFAAADLAERVGRALKRQALIVKNERRLGKLRDAVRRLNDARKVVSKKVDLLCNDLISAYGELSRQLDLVRTQEGFKHFLGDIKDLEQLLCHTMDYLMRQMGYCNIAIWLAGDDSDFQLGAYMKYTLPGEQDLTEAMRGGLVKLASRDGFIHLKGDEAQEALTPAELDYLADQDILAVNCTYLGEVLGVIVCFRDADKGFIEADAACVKSISPLFAVSLAAVVRPTGGEHGGGGNLLENDDDDDSRGRGDDWWKKGEAPPF